MKEGEPRGFGQGENPSIPAGEKIADRPFAEALRALAVKRGFESQFSLSVGLETSEDAVRTWYRGKCVPSLTNFDNLLILLGPSNEEKEALVGAYEGEIRKRRGKADLEQSRLRMKHLETPLNKWIEEFCEKRRISMNYFFRNAGFSNYKTARTNRGRFGLDYLNKLLQNAPNAFGLSEEEIESLSQAVSLEVKKKSHEGRRRVYRPRGVLNEKQERV